MLITSLITSIEVKSEGKLIESELLLISSKVAGVSN